MTNDVLIRNFQLTRNVLASQDILVNHYQLKGSAILLIQELCLKHNSYNAYIEFKKSDLNLYMSSKCFYRALDKLQNENIISIVNYPIGKQPYRIYFTENFIRKVCNKEFADLYSKWLTQQMKFKINKEEGK